MKANQRLRAARISALCLAIGLTSACVAPSVVPETRRAPAVAASPRPSPPATTAPPPSRPAPTMDIPDAPVTAGDWTWSMEGTRSVARFGGNLLVLRCSKEGTIDLLRPAPVAAAASMTITTTNGAREIASRPASAGETVLAATLSAADPLLDAMAYSRGRFAVAIAGMPTLTVPSWPEIGRVVEDCRVVGTN